MPKMQSGFTKHEERDAPRAKNIGDTCIYKFME